MAENIGLMSGAFFVGKGELLKWINDFFRIGYVKVEDVASGALHCQILDSIFPGQVALHKVNFNAKFDYEFVANYKVLQEVFTKQGIKQHVPVDRLIKAKYQDNLEFLQWMKHFWDVRYTGEEYDALVRREEAMARYAKEHKFAGKGGAAAPAAAKPAAAKPASRPAPVAARPVTSKPAPKAVAPAVHAKPAAKPHPEPTDDGDAKHDDGQDDARAAKLRLTIEGLEKERNFYFGKLREIEILCQADEHVDSATKQAVLQILYATDDNADFAPPAETQEAPADEEPQLQDDGVVDGVQDEQAF